MVDNVNNRRSSRRNSRSRSAARANLLANPRFDRYLLIAMTLVSATYVASTAYDVRSTALGLGMLAPGMTRVETRYVMGPPQFVERDGARWQTVVAGVDPLTFGRWRYKTPGGGVTQIDFDADHAHRISCTDLAAIPTSCPGVIDLTLGSSEDDLLNRLGAPDSQRFEGDTKIVRYDGLGLEFALRQLIIYRISLSERGGTLTWLGRAIRALLP